MGCCGRVLLVTLVIAACAIAFASGGDKIDADALEDEASTLPLASFARSVVTHGISAAAAVTNASTELSARLSDSVRELGSLLRHVMSGTGTSASDVRCWLAAEHCEAGAALPVGGSDTVAASRHVMAGNGSSASRVRTWPVHHHHPFIVLTETKFSFRCIPVWIGTLLTGLGSKKTHVIMFSP